MFIISYTVIFHICLYVYDIFHILLSCESLKDLGNVCMYVCISFINDSTMDRLAAGPSDHAVKLRVQLRIEPR
jgi:hypothetical protein